MSCKVSLEKLDDTMKQLIEQQTALANDIKLKDLEIAQAKESLHESFRSNRDCSILKRSRTST